MDSGLFTKVFTSPEVLAVSLALVFLLPLVFFIASTRSRRRMVRVVPRGSGRLRPAGSGSAASAAKAKRGRGAQQPAAAPRGNRGDDAHGADEDDDLPGPRRSSRADVLDDDEGPEDRA